MIAGVAMTPVAAVLVAMISMTALGCNDCSGCNDSSGCSTGCNDFNDRMGCNGCTTVVVAIRDLQLLK